MPVKTRTFVIAIALIAQFTLAALAQDESGFDFRKTRWGMSVAEVKASEGNILIADGPKDIYDNILVYKGMIARLPTLINYFFISGQLVQASYALNVKHSNENLYIEDFNNIKNVLISKYGHPIEDSVIWKDDTYKNDPEDYGFAISVGDLALQNMWKTSSTEIYLTLRGDNYHINIAIPYMSTRLKSLIESKEKSAEERDF